MRRFVEAVKPQEIHLLGLGAKSKKVPAYFDGVHEANPGTLVWLYSNLVRSPVGRDKDTGEATRPLTAAQDRVRDEQIEGWNREIEGDEYGADGDYTEELMTSSTWIAERHRRLTATRKKEAIVETFKGHPIAGQVRPRRRRSA